MQHEQFLGLGMGVPKYLEDDLWHLKKYDTDEVQTAEGGMSVIIEIIDDIIYDPNSTTCITRQGLDSSEVIMFRREYATPGDSYMGQPGDVVTFDVRHTQYLGKSALKQDYLVSIQTQLEGKDTKAHMLTTNYFIEQNNDSSLPYYAMISRPDILAAGNMGYDLMTSYDFNEMLDDLEFIEHLTRQTA